ncbi:MAG TPA: hypothetical protein VIF62_37200 [Labilithrix sp.]|jgi:hypothetical protein
MHRSLLLLFFLVPVAVVAACATDNGQGVFGDQFGPNDRVDAAMDATPVEGGQPGDDGGGPADATPEADAAPSCTGSGTVAVLAGADASLSGAVQIDGAAWAGGAIAGGGAASLPALVPFGAGFLGLTRGPSDVLQSVTATTSFGMPTTVVASGVVDSPALAVVGTSAHGVFSGGGGGSHDFFHGVNAGSSWDSFVDPVGTPPGDPQSFGSSAASLAGAGGSLVFTQAGNDNGLYVRTWNASWSAAAGISGAGAYTAASPAIASVTGSFDVVIVFAEKTSTKIEWTARSATDATQWSNPVVTNDLAMTTQPLSLASAGASSLVVAFEGEDGKGYASTGTISGTSITWAPAVPLVAGGVSVDSPPRVAKGVCGDDAIVAFASAGAVKVVRLRAGAWSAPEAVTGVSGSRVAVATK